MGCLKLGCTGKDSATQLVDTIGRSRRFSCTNTDLNIDTSSRIECDNVIQKVQV
jgi:hypothetical protein